MNIKSKLLGIYKRMKADRAYREKQAKKQQKIFYNDEGKITHRLPRNRKTTTAARQKRAATKRRNKR